jgi:hypothetical protein
MFALQTSQGRLGGVIVVHNGRRLVVFSGRRALAVARQLNAIQVEARRPAPGAAMVSLASPPQALVVSRAKRFCPPLPSHSRLLGCSAIHARRGLDNLPIGPAVARGARGLRGGGVRSH